mmetsp:Transcript_134970/g.376146  ORF Transcript_134970/g.376146 Transcript_134970/m.376146 type:complete len:217 (-) Transcript_134970:17-667(-)
MAAMDVDDPLEACELIEHVLRLQLRGRPLHEHAHQVPHDLARAHHDDAGVHKGAQRVRPGTLRGGPDHCAHQDTSAALDQVTQHVQAGYTRSGVVAMRGTAAVAVAMAVLAGHHPQHDKVRSKGDRGYKAHDSAVDVALVAFYQAADSFSHQQARGKVLHEQRNEGAQHLHAVVSKGVCCHIALLARKIHRPKQAQVQGHVRKLVNSIAEECQRTH